MCHGHDPSSVPTVDQSDGRSTDGESSGSVVECKPDAHRRGGLTVAASRHTIKERYVKWNRLGKVGQRYTPCGPVWCTVCEHVGYCCAAVC